jgi:hypothetical protein
MQQQYRTVNGELLDLSEDQFQKYRVSVRASDQQPPAVDGVWNGQIVTVDCTTELAVAGTFEESTEMASESPFGRSPVPGSVRHESGFTFYRPRLILMIIGFNLQRDEYGAVIGWTLTMEEV